MSILDWFDRGELQAHGWIGRGRSMIWEWFWRADLRTYGWVVRWIFVDRPGNRVMLPEGMRRIFSIIRQPWRNTAKTKYQCRA